VRQVQQRMKHRGVKATRCGVAVHEAQVRGGRERPSAAITSHAGEPRVFFKGLPSCYLPHARSISFAILEASPYFEGAYVVVDWERDGDEAEGATKAEYRRRARSNHTAQGAERWAPEGAITEMLKRSPRAVAVSCADKMRRSSGAEAAESPRKAPEGGRLVQEVEQQRPEWMDDPRVSRSFAELRPDVPLDGGRVATSVLKTSIAASSTGTNG